MAWHRPGNKPWSEPMMVSLLMHICITWPHRVNQTVDLLSYNQMKLYTDIRRFWDPFHPWYLHLHNTSLILFSSKFSNSDHWQLFQWTQPLSCLSLWAKNIKTYHLHLFVFYELNHSPVHGNQSWHCILCNWYNIHSYFVSNEIPNQCSK